MLAKLTKQNQLPLPEQAMKALGTPTHVNIQIDGERVILTHAEWSSGDAIRDRLESMELDDTDVEDAILWARNRHR